jgi:NAD(P)-dependent dehydrogenase (short-subunit alcohol dehydrogenase family)
MAGAAAFPAQALVGLSGYIVSKVALAKLMEFLAAENPNVTFMALHPGMVDTGLFRSSGATPEMLPMDTRTYCAGLGMG